MKIIKSSFFLHEVAILKKKYQKIWEDIQVFETLFDIVGGVSLGQGLFKFRSKNTSIPVGKRWGFRIILLVLDSETVLLLSIYSKTDKENISMKEIETILAGIGI